jgi:cardiolipin synthase
LSRPLSMQPLPISKANTFAQIVLAGFVLGELGLGLGLHGLIAVLIWVTGALTIFSAAAYFWEWLKHMARYEPAPAPLPPRRRKAAKRDEAEPSRIRAS